MNPNQYQNYKQTIDIVTQLYKKNVSAGHIVDEILISIAHYTITSKEYHSQRSFYIIIEKKTCVIDYLIVV